MKQLKKNWMSFKKNLYLLIGKRFYIKKTPKLFYLIDMRNRIDRLIDAFSEYEKSQINFFFKQLRENNCSCFIDIGSHWGLYSMRFSCEKCFDQAEIHAFEPDKINRYQLYANLFLNKLQDRITVHSYAISNEDGSLKFHHYNENNRGRSHITDNGKSTVETRKLDTLIKLKGKVIGIKIDIEGHESNAISGMIELLNNNKCILQVESFSDQLPELSTKLAGMGYSKIKSIQSDHYFSN